jgi:hypothetical protein
MEQKRFSRALVCMASRLSAAWRIVGNILRSVSTGPAPIFMPESLE